MLKSIIKKIAYIGITKEKSKARVREQEQRLFRDITKRYSRGNVLLQQGRYKSRLEERDHAEAA